MIAVQMARISSENPSLILEEDVAQVLGKKRT